jgi:GPH family glycoside/pentoside/hexuronide:cation symporter
MAELTIDPEERAKLSLFAGVGTGFGISITYLLPILFIDLDAVPFSQNLPVFYYIVLILAIFGAIFLAFPAFGIKERPEFMPEKSEKLNMWYCTKTTLKNKAFLTFVIFNFMMTYVVFAIQSNLPFYMADVLEVSSENILGSTPLLMFIIFSIFGYPVGLYLNKKKGNKRALFILSIIVVFGFILVTFSNDALLANISFMIIGFGYSGQTLLVFTLLADIIDKDELNTGQRREGMFFGINALVTKPAQSVSAMISGFIFAFTNFNQNLGVGETQPASAVFGIKLLIGLIPAIFIVVGLISLWYYPLDGASKEYKEMKRQVSILHLEKIDRLKEKLSSSKNNK